MLISICFDFACHCGVTTSGVMVHNVRINKGSIKSVANDRAFGFMPDICTACKAPITATAHQYIAADDLAKVNAYRESKGWKQLDGDLGTVDIAWSVAA